MLQGLKPRTGASMGRASFVHHGVTNPKTAFMGQYTHALRRALLVVPGSHGLSRAQIVTKGAQKANLSHPRDVGHHPIIAAFQHTHVDLKKKTPPATPIRETMKSTSR